MVTAGAVPESDGPDNRRTSSKGSLRFELGAIHTAADAEAMQDEPMLSGVPISKRWASHPIDIDVARLSAVAWMSFHGWPVLSGFLA
jgi:hypothetical protein